MNASEQATDAASVYRVIETSEVTDTELTRILNEMTGDGWLLDGIHFAMRESSRRPAMAFLLFCRAELSPAN